MTPHQTPPSVPTDEMVEQAASMQPRPLTQSEIVSLRQDAISIAAEMKKLMLERHARAEATTTV